jgi:hypothetical protein
MSIDSIVIQVPSSHLYRGMHLRAVCEEATRCLVLKRCQIIAVLLLFEDGSYAPADLVQDKGGRVALHVAAYTTAHGTSIGARIWTATSIEARDDGLDIRLGYRFP